MVGRGVDRAYWRVGRWLRDMGGADDERMVAGLVGEAHPHLLAAGAQADDLAQCLVVDFRTDRKDVACSQARDPAVRPRRGRPAAQQRGRGRGHKELALTPHDVYSVSFLASASERRRSARSFYRTIATEVCKRKTRGCDRIDQAPPPSLG